MTRKLSFLLILFLCSFLVLGAAPVKQPDSSGRYFFAQNCMWGFLDASGKIAIPAQYENVTRFSEGLAGAMKGGRWGFIDANGNLVIPFRYENVNRFSEGLTAVKLSGKWGYLDRTGNTTIPFRYQDAESFSEAVAPVSQDGKWFFIDREEKIIFEERFEDAYPFSDGIARVQQAKKWGYIDKKGKWLLPPQFEEAENVAEGYFPAKVEGGWHFFSRQGQKLFGKYEDAYPFSNGLAAVQINKKWGYINTKGDLVIPAAYDSHESFTEGMAVVKSGNERHLINRTGETIVKIPSFTGETPPHFVFLEPGKSELQKPTTNVLLEKGGFTVPAPPRRWGISRVTEYSVTYSDDQDINSTTVSFSGPAQMWRFEEDRGKGKLSNQKTLPGGVELWWGFHKGENAATGRPINEVESFRGYIRKNGQMLGASIYPYVLTQYFSSSKVLDLFTFVAQNMQWVQPGNGITHSVLPLRLASIPAKWEPEVYSSGISLARKDDLGLPDRWNRIQIYPAYGYRNLGDAAADIVASYARDGQCASAREVVPRTSGDAIWVELSSNKFPYFGAVSSRGRIFFVRGEYRKEFAKTPFEGMKETFQEVLKGIESR